MITRYIGGCGYGLNLFDELQLNINYLGNASVELDAPDEAERYFLEAMRIASEARAVHIALSALVGLAALQREDPKQALELLMYVLEHPASSKEAKTRAERLCVELKAQLSQQQVEVIEVRIQTKSLEVVMQEILEAS